MDTVETLVTERLVLRKPTPADARDLFERYASDPVVTRYLAWPRHESIDDTLAFLRRSEEAWSAQQAGPYVILDRDETVLGTTGLDIETPHRAATGYVLVRDAAGRGYATEAAKAMIRLADTLHIRRLYALCHP